MRQDSAREPHTEQLEPVRRIAAVGVISVFELCWMREVWSPYPHEFPEKIRKLRFS
jgi:hypothetical protein